jgi:hypothetical protein
VRKLIGAAVAAAGCAVLCPAASAFTAPKYAVSPMTLPSAGARAAAAQPARWLVGARPDVRVDKVARGFGARPLDLKCK